MTLLVEVQSDLPQKLIQLEICQIDEFYIAFQKTLFYYSVQVKILCVIYRAEGQHLEIYELLNCCKSLQFTLINKDTGTLKFKSKFIISTQGYKQSYINNYFLLHHFDDKVVVQLNEQLHFYLHSEFFKFFQISDMPYFVSVESNGKLSIFKLENGDVYLKEMKSKMIGIYKILGQKSEIIKVEPFDIHNLQLKITPQITPIIQQNFDIKINISLINIQETLPLTLFSIEQNGDEIGFDEGFGGFQEATIKNESIKNNSTQ
ncbi:unnamed protein product [Paramecium octaurelia]|uniref:Uncharacterized protein n=1 Tax=Paramecium octaurelia TaxID=43137 RepID=A0A8S1YMN6_PAROT|nr:unnamed protein product [Paramecium octaurelia]CAD8214888.1 unnamed protein product [Paramecium octaurelia]